MSCWLPSFSAFKFVVTAFASLKSSMGFDGPEELQAASIV